MSSTFGSLKEINYKQIELFEKPILAWRFDCHFAASLTISAGTKRTN
jgi:hypothetical protein